MQPSKFMVVYGGSFDPVHKGHENIVKSLLQQRIAREVWVVPCAKRSDKHFILDDEERFLMLEQVFKEMPEVKLLKTEIIRGAMIPTYQLLTLFKQEHPQLEFAFVIGADLVKQLPKWKHPQQLRKEVNFIVCSRAGFDIDPNSLPEKSTVIQIPPIQISSTEILNVAGDATLTLAEKQAKLSPLLSPPVLALLKEKQILV